MWLVMWISCGQIVHRLCMVAELKKHFHFCDAIIKIFDN